MRCLFCGNIPAPFEASFMPHLPFECCPVCETPYGYTYKEQKTLTQCCECGLMLSGPCEGIQFTTTDGKPDLRIGVSHGMCQPCADKKLAQWVVRRATRSTKPRAA